MNGPNNKLISFWSPFISMNSSIHYDKASVGWEETGHHSYFGGFINIMDVTRLEVVEVVNAKFGLGHSLGHMQALVGSFYHYHIGSLSPEGTASMDHGCFRHASCAYF